MEAKLPEIWVLVDEVAGHNAQSIGVAEAMGLPFSKKKVVYNDKAKLPNFLKFNGFSAVDIKHSDNLSGNPDIIISCGRKLAPVALTIKNRAKKKGIKTFCCHIMWPGFWQFFGMGLVAVPSHDNLNFLLSNSKRIIRTIGSPNRINKEFLLQEFRIWGKTIGDLPSPKIVALVGGNSRKTTFSKGQAEILVDKITKLVAGLGASLLVTNSRRTDPAVTDFMKSELKKRIGRHYFFHDVHTSKANPFFAFLQLADIIIATGDSISMCSEACTTGKPLFIYSPDGNAPQKHRRFHTLLYTGGYAQELNSDSLKKILNNYPNISFAGKALNTSKQIAEEITKRVGKVT